MPAVSELSIQPAGPAEAKVFSRFHVEIWRQTYRELAPPDAYALLDENRRLAYWKKFLTETDVQSGAFFAADDDGLAGLVSFGPPQADIFGKLGEVKHLYVRADMRGSGLGRRLLVTAMQAMYRAEYPGVGLAVVRENHAARRFYAAMGGKEVAEFQDLGPLWKSSNILVTWQAPACGRSNV